MNDSRKVEMPVPMPRWRRWAITLFILVHLYIMVFWGMPGSNFRAMMVRPIQDYTLKSGLWHSWDMFAPDPLSVNYHLQAHVRFEDGAWTTWDVPRMDHLGLWERFQKERFRKFRERVRQDAYRASWDDVSRWIARRHQTATNRPAQVILSRHWESVPPPVMKPGTFEYQDYQPIERNQQLRFNFRFQFYDVQREDL